ncbi:Rieske 2Fe-2S domain-containing protein [Rhizobium sp. YIM 134829]|uniref:Rieske 2Fe-2S domain-containing protein n=1 Tax=Rhizobium sp. YIM 134829 TaxID=3390453 RepID=UPI00397A4FF9
MLPTQPHAWTPVALSADLPAASVLPAHLPGGALAVWRAEDGTVSAVADRCPHRGMRLSHGFVRGEALSCIYHGWRYGKTGRCLAIPAHPALSPPDAIRVATYRTGERDGIIWVTRSQEAGALPAHDGFVGLRSITLASTPEALVSSLGGTAEGGSLDGTIGGVEARLLMAPAGDEGALLCHLLVAADAMLEEKVAASRGLEELRRRAEAAGTTRAAA